MKMIHTQHEGRTRVEDLIVCRLVLRIMDELSVIFFSYHHLFYIFWYRECLCCFLCLLYHMKWSVEKFPPNEITKHNIMRTAGITSNERENVKCGRKKWPSFFRLSPDVLNFRLYPNHSFTWCGFCLCSWISLSFVVFVNFFTCNTISTPALNKQQQVFCCRLHLNYYHHPVTPFFSLNVSLFLIILIILFSLR